MAVEILWYAPAYISRVCRALPYMGASITDTRAYEATTLSVDAVKAYSCRSDYGSYRLARSDSSGLVDIVTCRLTV
jgi:hypothetical protein